MKYIFKLFKLEIASDNYEYAQNQLTLNSSVDYIYCKLDEYIIPITTIDTKSECKLSYKFISELWNKNRPEYLADAKFAVAPMYRDGEIFIIGVIILSPFNDKTLLSNNSFKSHTLICHLISGTTSINGSSYLNILKGVLALDDQKSRLIKQYIKIEQEQDSNISLLVSVQNMKNYLPKVEIKIKEKTNNTLKLLNAYKLRSNSSKSIKLPTSLPATLSE